MSSTLAQRYNDELASWQQAMDLYWDEIINLEEKLEGILALNTIPERSMKAEQLLNQMMLLRIEVGTITEGVHQQEIMLKGDNEPLEDSKITTQVTTNQESLRQHMKMLELDLTVARKDGNDFLARDWR